MHPKFDKLITLLSWVIVAAAALGIQLAYAHWRVRNSAKFPMVIERGALNFGTYIVVPVYDNQWHALTNKYPQFYTAANIKFN